MTTALPSASFSSKRSKKATIPENSKIMLLLVQAVAYSGDTSSTAANVAIATKKQGLMFCNLSDEQPSLPSARHLQFSHLFEEVRLAVVHA
jgi:hypothetical protein